MREMMEPPFWLVWCEDGGEPRVKHDHRGSAEGEARRLAAAHPGKRFCVLPCLGRFSVNNVLVETFDADAIPF